MRVRILRSQTERDAEPNLVAVAPEGEHGFPPDQREAAYRFIDEALQWHPPEN